MLTMNKTVGKLTSEPDAEGRHKLKCPNCKTIFLSVITKDEKTNEINPITCTSCSHSAQPLAFLHELNKEKELKLVKDYADKEIKKAFKRFK